LKVLCDVHSVSHLILLCRVLVLVVEMLKGLQMMFLHYYHLNKLVEIFVLLVVLFDSIL
jgi:hypothetical protein